MGIIGIIVTISSMAIFALKPSFQCTGKLPGSPLLSTPMIEMPPAPPAVASTCGHSSYYHQSNEPGKGIIGGKTAHRNQFPWVVRLRITPSSGSSWLCGASIISESFLLTAGHCAKNAREITAIIADYDKKRQDDDEYVRNVSEITIHPKYFNNGDGEDYDFALLKLSENVSFSEWKAQKICLPESCSAGCSPKTTAFIAGWGTLSQHFTLTPRLLQVGIVQIQSSDLCKKQYEGLATISDRMICAGVQGGGVDACSGDSGGPLMVQEDGFFKLCGITSWGNGCGRSSHFGVYARVCSVIDWIRSKTNKEEPSYTTTVRK